MRPQHGTYHERIPLMNKKLLMIGLMAACATSVYAEEAETATNQDKTEEVAEETQIEEATAEEVIAEEAPVIS